MKHVRRAVLVLLVAVGGGGVGRGSGAHRAAEEASTSIAGTWRGHSVCLVKSSPCHDEVNVYRFSKLPGKPASFSLTASKVVDDKEIVMGSGGAPTMRLSWWSSARLPVLPVFGLPSRKIGWKEL
jgi:hypothetical protein